MLNKLYDYYFWFAQPSSVLSSADMIFGWIFLACLILAVLLSLVGRMKGMHAVPRKLLKKLLLLNLSTGLSGLVWLGLRYENTPIFALRAWAGLTLLIGLLWLLFVIKYFLTRYRTEKNEFDREILKNKYLPK